MKFWRKESKRNGEVSNRARLYSATVQPLKVSQVTIPATKKISKNI